MVTVRCDLASYADALEFLATRLQQDLLTLAACIGVHLI